MDEILKSKKAAWRKANRSVEGIFKAMIEVGERVKQLESGEQKSGHWSELLAVKRDRDNLVGEC